MVVIAKAHGAAIGGGCGLVVGADIAVTHPDAKLGFPEVDLGVCPAVVAPLLVQKVGAGRARRILLSGGTMSGHEALAWGVVDHCVERGELDGFVGELAGRIAKAGPASIAATKRHLNTMAGDGFAALVREGAALSAEVIAGAEAQERLSKLYG
jgi:enoyl-CoA hydratase/carnithine racemase